VIKKIIIHNHELDTFSPDCLNCRAGYVPAPTEPPMKMNDTNTPTTHDLLLQRLEELEEQARERLGEAKQRAREAHEELESVLYAAAAAFGTHDFAAWRRVRDRAFDAAEATEAAVAEADAAVQAARRRAHALRTAHDDVQARRGALRETMEERQIELNQAIKAEHEAQERLERASQAEADARNAYRNFEFRYGHL
jgi:chromosome segregation ATPase